MDIEREQAEAFYLKKTGYESMEDVAESMVQDFNDPNDVVDAFMDYAKIIREELLGEIEAVKFTSGQLESNYILHSSINVGLDIARNIIQQKSNKNGITQI